MRWVGTFILGMACLGLAGCAGYRLGPTSGATAGARSIQVNLFQNETMEARLTEAVASSLRRRLQQDGTYRLATHDEGEVIVNGTLTRYRRSPLSNQPHDVRIPRDFSVTLVARVVATERSTGRILLDREAIGRTTIRSGADFTSIQREQLPILADDLARMITSLLVDGDW